MRRRSGRGLTRSTCGTARGRVKCRRPGGLGVDRAMGTRTPHPGRRL
jgi:hypothetical protein